MLLPRYGTVLPAFTRVLYVAVLVPYAHASMWTLAGFSCYSTTVVRAGETAVRSIQYCTSVLVHKVLPTYWYSTSIIGGVRHQFLPLAHASIGRCVSGCLGVFVLNMKFRCLSFIASCCFIGLLLGFGLLVVLLLMLYLFCCCIACCSMACAVLFRCADFIRLVYSWVVWFESSSRMAGVVRSGIVRSRITALTVPGQYRYLERTVRHRCTMSWCCCESVTAVPPPNFCAYDCMLCLLKSYLHLLLIHT